MSNRTLLSEEDIKFNLMELPIWTLSENTIIREISTPNFAAAVGFINSIAVFAESMDHHPDILIYGWNKVRVSISTHSAGGLTILDFELAKKIETLVVNLI